MNFRNSPITAEFQQAFSITRSYNLTGAKFKTFVRKKYELLSLRSYRENVATLAL
jgi:hypothetical protein